MTLYEYVMSILDSMSEPQRQAAYQRAQLQQPGSRPTKFKGLYPAWSRHRPETVRALGMAKQHGELLEALNRKA